MKKETFENGLEGLLTTLDAIGTATNREKTREIMTYIERCQLQPPKVKARFDLTKGDGTTQASYTVISRWE